MRSDSIKTVSKSKAFMIICQIFFDGFRLWLKQQKAVSKKLETVFCYSTRIGFRLTAS